MQQIQHMCTHLYRVCLLEWFTGAFGKEEPRKHHSSTLTYIAIFCTDLELLLYSEHWDLLIDAFSREGNSTNHHTLPPGHISYALSCWFKSLKYFMSFKKFSIR